MTDQVSSTGGLASGLPVIPLVTLAAGSNAGIGGSANIAESSPSPQNSPVPATPTGSPGQAVEQINNHLRQSSTQLQVQVDTETGKTIYKVVDPTTGQVVLQVPSAQVLAMAHALQSMDSKTGSSGVLVDQKG